MKKGEKHPSTKLYQEFIIQAFLELILEKNISDITVTEICERAKIARRTFYRHFDKKEDVIECYVLQLMGKLADTLAETAKNGNLYHFIRSFFVFWKPHLYYIQALIHGGFSDLIFTCYLKCLLPLSYQMPASVVPNGSECHLAYLLGGLWSLFIYWLQHGCIQTPEELASIVTGQQSAP